MASPLACGAVSDRIVREATERDVGGVVAGYEWLFAPPGLRPPDWDPVRGAATVRRLLADERAAVLVAADGDAVVGICTVYLDIDSVRFGQRAWVEDLAVDPARRSAGVGKALLDAACEWARSRGATHLELDSADARTDAHRFYRREGASHTSRLFGWELGGG